MLSRFELNRLKSKAKACASGASRRQKWRGQVTRAGEMAQADGLSGFRTRVARETRREMAQATGGRVERVGR